MTRYNNNNKTLGQQMNDKISKDVNLNYEGVRNLLNTIIVSLGLKTNAGNGSLYVKVPYDGNTRIEFELQGSQFKLEGFEIPSGDQIEKISNLSDVSTAKREICDLINKVFSQICSAVVSNVIANRIFEIEKILQETQLKDKWNKKSKDLHEDKIESEAKEDSVRRIKI